MLKGQKVVEWWWDKGLGGEILTDPPQTILPSRQSGLLPQRRPCHHWSWERSSPLLQGHMRTLPALFRQTCRQGKHTAKPHRSAHKHTLTLHSLTTGCYAIITQAFKDGTWAISSFINDPRHSWWQSNSHPAGPWTSKHLNFALMKSAKLMSWITMKTHFFHIKPALWMKTWNPGLHQQGQILQRGRLFSNVFR